MFEYYEVRFKFTTGRPSTIVLRYKLFNIVGQKIDGNYESWKNMRQKTTSRGTVFPTPGVRRFFRCCSNNAHLFFHIAYFPKTTVDMLIEDIFLYNMVLWDLC